MRKTILCTMAAMVAIGCSQFEEFDTAPTGTVHAPQTLNATCEEPTSDTRTYVASDNTLHWHADDEISYFPGVAANVQYFVFLVYASGCEKQKVLQILF